MTRTTHRYEILEEIGRGGLGSVFRARDTKMNRDVALKRIRRTDEVDIQEEAARQLLDEAGALATVQHPNIVTIYDLGSDEAGPFVIMELLSGRSLDKIVEEAPMTVPDFCEVALQTQEALVAAHSAGLLHRDIKPGNVMLHWLPSGKLQVKMVDFGLAVIGEKLAPSMEAAPDEIFGSVSFMSPEQFQRKPLDARTDLYSMGCVYYYMLSGEMPFGGGNANEVMTSHMEHRVRPILTLRPDLPVWLAEWVMWHIEREPEARPENARATLGFLLNHLQIPSAAMTQEPTANAPEEPKRPRLIIPGAEPPSSPPISASGPIDPLADPPTSSISPPPTPSQPLPQPLSPPPGSEPSVHAAVVPSGPLGQAAATGPASGQIQAGPSSVPLAKAIRTATRPVLGTTPIQKGPAATQQGTLEPRQNPVSPQGPVLVVSKKRGMSNAAKATVAAILGIAALIMVILLLKRSSENQQTERFNKLVTEAANPATSELKVNSRDLVILLANAADTGINDQRNAIYKALLLAKSTDGTDIDKAIVDFVLARPMLPEVKRVLIGRVLGERGNPEIVPRLIAFAEKSDETGAAVAAIEATRLMAADDQFESLLRVVQNNSSAEVRRAAEAALAELIRRSDRRGELANLLINSYKGTVDREKRLALLRLMGATGETPAADFLGEILGGSDKDGRLAAIAGLVAWPGDSQMEQFFEFMESPAADDDPTAYSQAFEGVNVLLTDRKREASDEEDREAWERLAALAERPAEEEKVVVGLALTQTAEWAQMIARRIADTSEDDRVADRAERAVSRMKSRAAEK